MTDYITYELWNPIKQQPFYVGYASRKCRPQDHIKEALTEGSEYKKGANPHKIYTIRDIHNAGKSVEIRIVFISDDKDAAIQKEIELITKYGRRDSKNGILTNMTNGGEGTSKRNVSAEERHKKSVRKQGKSFVDQFGEDKAQEIKKKIAESRQGQKSKYPAWNKGKTADNNLSVKKISDSRKGSTSWNKGIKMIDANPNYVNHFGNKKHTAESKKKVSNANKGRCAGKNNPMYGKSAVLGRKWYHDNLIQYYLFPDDPLITSNNLINGRLKKS